MHFMFHFLVHRIAYNNNKNMKSKPTQKLLVKECLNWPTKTNKQVLNLIIYLELSKQECWKPKRNTLINSLKLIWYFLSNSNMDVQRKCKWTSTNMEQLKCKECLKFQWWKQLQVWIPKYKSRNNEDEHDVLEMKTKMFRNAMDFYKSSPLQ